jgi:hypothetical protein
LLHCPIKPIDDSWNLLVKKLDILSIESQDIAENGHYDFQGEI